MKTFKAFVIESQIYKDISGFGPVKIDAGKLYKDGEEVGKVGVYVHNSGYIELAKIVVDPEFRKMGIGKQFMQQLLQYADKQGKIVALTPTSEFGMSKSMLTKWYKNFGFVMNKGANKNFEISHMMYRWPR